METAQRWDAYHFGGCDWSDYYSCVFPERAIACAYVDHGADLDHCYRDLWRFLFQKAPEIRFSDRLLCLYARWIAGYDPLWRRGRRKCARSLAHTCNTGVDHCDNAPLDPDKCLERGLDGGTWGDGPRGGGITDHHFSLMRVVGMASGKARWHVWRFHPWTTDEIRRDILAGLGFSLFLFALTAFAIEISLIFSHSPVIETILALAPGGQAELVVLALIVGADMTFVVAHHLLRIFFVILGAPVLAMLIPKRLRD